MGAEIPYLAAGLPCKNSFNSRILNTFEVYGKIFLCGIKYVKNAETFKRQWHIVQEGMPIILRDKTIRLVMPWAHYHF